MQCFDLKGATHFCSGSQAPAGTSPDSMRMIAGDLRRARHVGETDPLFLKLRTACLSDVDRLLFLSASQYRHACDLLHAGGVHWALVTLYYTAFFSAKALLGMFGVWVDERYVVMEVNVARPGSQRVRILRMTSSVESGTHRRFWDEFYQSANNLKPWVDPSDQWVLGPIRGDTGYLIATRNTINLNSS